VGECPVGAGLGEVGEASGRAGDGLVGVGEGLGRRVVRVGLGVGVEVGLVAEPVVPSGEDDPLDEDDAGRTSR